ncbi:MAG: mechanosensitive ion channel family protein [Chitinispirillaceae bacterium]|nr:mechanosensitive ion channel family protein [Chitinispirillaceae bacterium]
MDSINWRDITDGLTAFLRGNIISLAGLLLLIILLERIATLLADRYVKSDERQHALKKWVRYFALFFGFLCVLFIYGTYAHKDIFFLVGLFLAGVAISLRDVFSNFIGWLIINSPKGFSQGDRITVGQLVTGDVIDIGVLRTTLAEIGVWVNADQSTGRLVTIPNSFILTNTIHNYTVGNDLIWNELPVTVTFESDWEKAERLMLAVAEKDFEEKKESMLEQIRKARKRYLVRYNFITPKVYVTIAASGVLLTLRYMVSARRRRTMDDEFSREILLQFGGESAIDLAYPTTRIYRKDGPAASL